MFISCSLRAFLISRVYFSSEDLFFGIFYGEYSSSVSYHERRSDFGDCSSSSKHNLAIYRGIQSRALNDKEPFCVNTSTETETEAETGQNHGGIPIVFKG